MADFNFYVNRQGIRGRKGERGEQGFSPIISVKTQTANEYVLTVQNEDGSFDTPNLRGNAIANTGGTYIRYNQETGAMYTGYADIASYEQQGEVLFATYEQLENGGEEFLGVTSADVYEFVTSKVQDLGFDALAHTLVAGSNITLDVDDENEEITISAAGTDLSNYVTLNTEQTITAKKISNLSRTGNNIIYNAEFNGGINASLKIGSAEASSDNDNDIPLIVANKLRIGTTDNNIAPNFVCPSDSHLPSIGIFDITNTGVVVTDSTWHPIFSDLNLTFGTGLTVTTSGSGTAKKYTVTASSDLTNYVTLNTAQTITGTKTFQYGLSSYGAIKARNIRIWDGGQVERGLLSCNDAGTTKVTLSSKGILEFKSWSNGASSGYTSRTVDLADILTTSEITTTIDSQSTNDKVPSAAAVYNALNNVGTVNKITATNSLLTESGGYATMTISNTLSTDEVNVSVYQIGVSSNTQVYPTVEVNSSTVSVTFPASADIPADTYKVVITG